MHEELLSIGAFAARCQLSVKMLRHYHDIGLLEPERVDPSSGYRYYAPSQVRTAAAIASLRSLDLPLADIREVLTADPHDVGAILDRHRQQLEAAVETNRRRLDFIVRLLTKEEPMAASITEIDIAPLRVISLELDHVEPSPTTQAAAFFQLYAALEAQGQVPSGPPMGIISPAETSFRMEAAFPATDTAVAEAPARIRVLDAVHAAVTQYNGPPDQITPVVNEVMEWVTERGGQLLDTFRVLLHKVSLEGSGEMVSEVQVPFVPRAQ